MSLQNQDIRLILASGSPRRRELLGKMGYEFEIIIPQVDENAEGPANKVVAELSLRKATAVADTVDNGLIIASDTLVSVDGKVLGKPKDVQEACKMLSMLSGRTHEVFSGVTVIDAKSRDSLTRSVRTGVVFRDISSDEIDEYIATGEPMDKAGAYAIQGGAGAFVSALDGSFENVMGFPVDEVREMLEEMRARMSARTEV